tara:strand:- start:4861 stop:7653 length:2793 start_codon:yes stop_codon:yes gene_type:complete
MSNSNDRIKVIGYAQRVFYDNGIEYRNFSDDLVGNQLTSDGDGENSLFTFGNFVTTINDSGRLSRLYSSKKFTAFYDLETLELNNESAKILLNNNIKTTLNLDSSNLSTFAYFGSSTEYIRVSLEKIITNWPASLYLNPLRESQMQTIAGNTFENYIYDDVTDSASFKVDTNFIINNYNINYKSNGTILNTFNETNSIRNLSDSFESYSILINSKEYEVIGFSGSTNNLDDHIFFKVIGDPFSGLTSGSNEYHIKPKELLEEKYFNSLSEFESNLLNRLTTPKYTSKYKYKFENDLGEIVNGKKTLTWPVSDGYNLDFDTPQYINYVSDLLDVTRSKDETQTNLIVRFLVAESITSFDTAPTCEGDITENFGEKITRTLKIYGREFDEIRRYITGIKYSNVVSYDKNNNIPDQLIKYLARTLGWELTSSLVGNDLITNYLKVGTSTYPGFSRGYTPQEAEVELWRRLILNSAHIWKSKGNRNPIEFFFKMIGTPDGLINFNEYIYKVKKPIDMDLFYKVLEYNDLDTDLEYYNLDSEGYPKFFRDTPNMYFQKGGGWYRETAGPSATQYTLVGNNPHVGPYDSGKEYIAQLENIIPNFSAFTITSTTVTTGTTNLFTNYNNGIINQYDGQTYVEAQSTEGVNLDDVVLLETSIKPDECPEPELTDCGCDVPEDDEALVIGVTMPDVKDEINCDNTDLIPNKEYDDIENVYQFTTTIDQPGGTPINFNSIFVNPYCCETKANGYPYLYTSYSRNIPNIPENPADAIRIILDSDVPLTEFNKGYICCKSPGIINDIGKNGCGCKLSCNWKLKGPRLVDMYRSNNNSYYLSFIDEEGNQRVVNESDSCFCPLTYTSPEIITDPYTNKQGYACKLNKNAEDIMTRDPISNKIYLTFKFRNWGINEMGAPFGCDEEIITVVGGDDNDTIGDMDNS